ncbi:Cholecystokinin receptor [Eumeta japonica]|uniref:Cholecystokinin receptor n=1 Tax=Eumeta variegata TaxID=151549 RepID=A0A4C1ZYE9_EUMVA|nr:Cholecystokinin receptor [Eumeta japonica]
MEWPTLRPAAAQYLHVICSKAVFDVIYLNVKLSLKKYGGSLDNKQSSQKSGSVENTKKQLQKQEATSHANFYAFGHLSVSVPVDVWTLVAISLERYFAICRPLKSRIWQTQCHAYRMIGIVWIFSLIINSPILYASTLQPMRGNAYKCREVWSSLQLERAFNLGLDAGLLLLPFFIMSFAYCLIVTKLWRGMKQEIQHNFNWQTQSENRFDFFNHKPLKYL